jgi:hypothetical protein
MFFDLRVTKSKGDGQGTAGVNAGSPVSVQVQKYIDTEVIRPQPPLPDVFIQSVANWREVIQGQDVLPASSGNKLACSRSVVWGWS